MTLLSQEQVTEQLANEFVAALDGDTTDQAPSYTQSVLMAKITGGILSAVGKFLADNSEFLPPKEAVVKAANSAIDLALDRLGRPWLTALISRPIKNMIETAISSMYDAILNPPTVV